MRLLRRKVRRPESFEKLQLEKVIGLTTGNANGLTCNPVTGDLAYVAGCVVVVYNAVTNHQSQFLMATHTPKALACLAYSPQGGKLLAAGESGHQPAVIIWDTLNRSCLCELKAHKYGVTCVEFSPNGRHLVSAGFPHDALVCLWDHKAGTLISKVRATAASLAIAGVQFTSDGSFLITAGANHLKRWVIALQAGRQHLAAGLGNLVDGRNVHLGSLQDSSFVSVKSPQGAQDGEIQPLYALTSTGILCLLHQGRAIKKWVNLKVRQGYALALLGLHIACACSDGIVRIFMLDSLAFVATLPRPAPIGFHDLTDMNTCTYLATHSVNGITYPDAVACHFATTTKLAVIYADHTLFVWDIQNAAKIVRYRSFLAHSGCIWDIANIPVQKKRPVSRHSSGNCINEQDEQGAFATCSVDGSIRLWCLGLQHTRGNAIHESMQTVSGPGNAYDELVSGVLYASNQEELEVSDDSNVGHDLNKGFRSISVSSDGHHLAVGDRNGNLHIYDLQSLQRMSFKEAHDAEILTLSFGTITFINEENQCNGVSVLASGGRDRLVHIYDINRKFDVIETLDDHSASITALKFACGGSKLLSSSADKSVVFRNIQATPTGVKSARYHQEMASRGTIYDMDVDPWNKLAVTVGQDKRINLLSLVNGKSLRCFKPDGDAGEPIKVRIDPSSSYLVCSHSDKSMRIYDISSGDLLSLGQGHAEVITGLAFMSNCKHLVSVSGDSCIFIWRLPRLLSKAMKKRCMWQSESPSFSLSTKFPQFDKMDETSSTEAGKQETHVQKDELDALRSVASNTSPAFKFSISRLPHWAQSKVAGTRLEIDQHEDASEDSSVHSFESRWVERLGSEGYKLFSEPLSVTPPATIHPSKVCIRRRFTIEPTGTSTRTKATPESSLDSQLSAISTSSPKPGDRRHTEWNTVHTLFFDGEDCLEDDLCRPPTVTTRHGDCSHETSIIYPPDCSRRLFTQAKESVASHLSANEDGVVVYLSEDERECQSSLINEHLQNISNSEQNLESHMKLPASLAHMMSCNDERTLTVFCDSKSSAPDSNHELTGGLAVGDNHETQLLEANAHKHKVAEALTVPMGDETSDDEESEQFISPCSDFFDAHFAKLSSAMKVQTKQTSARSSFSARYFAQWSHGMPIVSLSEDPVKIFTGNQAESDGLLDTLEFKNLVLSEWKDNLAVEAQNKQEHPVNPSILERLSETDKVSTCTKEHLSGHLEHVEKSVESKLEMVDLISFEYPPSQQACNEDTHVEELATATTALWPQLVDDVGQEMPVASFEKWNSICVQTSKVKSGGDDLVYTEKPLRCFEEFKYALQKLSEAAETALNLYQEVEASSQKDAQGNLSSIYHEFVSPTLQRVWCLSDRMTSSGQCNGLNVPVCEDWTKGSLGDPCSFRSSANGVSQIGTVASFASNSSMLESNDIEGFIQQYSIRFSTTLANQVLHLVQKGLADKSL